MLCVLLIPLFIATTPFSDMASARIYPAPLVQEVVGSFASATKRLHQQERENVAMNHIRISHLDFTPRLHTSTPHIGLTLLLGRFSLIQAAHTHL